MRAKNKTNIVDFQKQKARLLRRSKIPNRLSFDQLIIRSTNDALILAEAEVRDAAIQTTMSESGVERRVFLARINIIKEVCKQTSIRSNFISKNWPAEATYLSKNKFPYAWMLTPTIQKALNRHKPLVPLLGYLHTMGKEATRDMKEEMRALADNKKFNGHPISCFIANKDFYGNVTSAVGIDERSVRRYIWTLFKTDILEFVKMYKGNVRIFSFGYYTQWDGRDQHRSYIKETTKYKKALREFALAN